MQVCSATITITITTFVYSTIQFWLQIIKQEVLEYIITYVKRISIQFNCQYVPEHNLLQYCVKLLITYLNYLLTLLLTVFVITITIIVILFYCYDYC